MTPAQRAKVYLDQLARLKVEIDQQRNEVIRLIATIDGIKGVSYDGEKVQSSPQSDPAYVRNVNRLLEIQSAAQAKELEYENARQKIIAQIQTMEERHDVEILYMRFVELKSLIDISGELHYSYKWTHTLCTRALEHFAYKYGL